MYERTSERDPLPSIGPTRMESDAGHIHQALYIRSGEIRKEMPDVEIVEELQDQEPRGILRIWSGGKLMRMEFFESTFSADQHRFLEEYVQAARDCGNIALLYPGLSFPEEYVLKKVEDVMDRAQTMGVQGDISVHGFLYDFEGWPREVV